MIEAAKRSLDFNIGGELTAFGDVRFLDLAVLDAGHRLLFGVGPTFVFPTANTRKTGQGKWQAGPAAAAAFTGAGNLAPPPPPAPAVKPKTKPLTRAQKLKAALNACHKDRKKAKRQRCERSNDPNLYDKECAPLSALHLRGGAAKGPGKMRKPTSF